MKFFRQVLNFYINSSLHVALAVVALTSVTLLEYNIATDKVLLLFVFFASVTGYNFVKYFGIAKFHHRSLSKWLKAIQMLSLICFIFLCYYALKLNAATLWCILGFAVVTFFYAIPFLPKHFYLDSKQNLRSVGGLKVYLIALIWTGVTVFLPVVNNDYSVNTDVILTATQRYAFIITIMLPFEIRDLNYDSLKLSTIPQQIGVKRTKILGCVLLAFLLLLEFFKDETVSHHIFVLLVVSIIAFLFLKYAEKSRSRYYTAFWVEALPVFWWLLMVVFN